MTDADSADAADDLGRCPECDATVPASAVLIEYEDGDGRAAYAACPSCGAVVKPERD